MTKNSSKARRDVGVSGEERVSGIISALRRRGCHLTPQRLAVIRHFLSREDHPSAGEIHEALRDQFPMMALSTVYDTLQLLVELGEAIEVAPTLATMRFDPNTSNHCHLVCVGCGSIKDLPSEECAAVRPAALASEDFQVLRQVHHIIGLCANCRRSA